MQNTCHAYISQFDLSKLTLKNLNKFDLSPTGKLVLLAIIDCYNPNKDEIYPKQKTIANWLGISERSVQRAIKELAVLGLLIYTCKNQNIYKLTGKIFELEKLSGNKRQTVRSQDDKLSYHEQIKQNKNNNKSKILNFNKPEGAKYKSTDTTRNEIKQSLNVSDKNIWNDKEIALKWLTGLTALELKLPPIQKTMNEIKIKWNL